MKGYEKLQTNKRKKILYFLTSSVFIGMIASSLLIPVEAIFLKKFTTDYSLIGIAIGISFIGTLIFSPLIGKLSDLFGRKKIVLLFTFFGSFVPLFLVISPDIWWYIVVKFLWGILGSCGAIIYAYIGDMIERSGEGGTFFGTYIMGGSLGGALGPIISGYLASFMGNLSIPYFLAFFLSCFSFLFLLPIIKYRETYKKVKTSKRTKKRGKNLKNLLIVSIIVLSFLFSFHMSMRNLLWPYIIGSFVESRFTPFYVGITFTSMGLIAGVFSIIAGKLSDKFGSIKIFFLGYFLMGIFGILFAASTSFFVFYIFSVLYAFGEILKGPATNVLVVKFVEKERRGFMFGLLSSIGGVASFFGPVITGVLLDFLNWRTILLIYGFTIFSLTLVFHTLLKKRKN